MSISTTPPPAPPKKKGLGCLGCGCLLLTLLAILLAGLMGGIAYWFYSGTIAVTTTTPAAIPSFDGDDDLYQTTLRKLADFDHDVKNHQAATIQFSADELNVLIARNPNVINNHLHAFVSLSDDEGRVQASIPTDALSDGFLKGRYFNFDASFEVHFDLTTKSINPTFHALQFGNKVLVGPNSNSGQTAANASLKQPLQLWLTSLIDQSFNNEIRQNPDGAALLDQAKSIEIKDGQLVIETR